MPDYDYSQPRSFGLVTGPTLIRSPWASQPCEACVLTCTFGDVGGLVISPEDGAPLPPSQTQQTNPEGMPGWAAFTQQANGAGISCPAVFFLLPKGTALAVATVAAAHTVWFSIVFRRPISRFVEMPALTEMAPEAEDQYHTIKKALADYERAQADAAAQPVPTRHTKR